MPSSATSSPLSIGQKAFWLDICNLLTALLMIVIAVFYYSQLPERIPSLFGQDGTPASYEHREVIFLLPGLALLISFVLYMLRRDPKYFNYPVKVTPYNEEALYQEGSQLISAILLITNLLLLYISWMVIRVSLGKAQEMKMLPLWIALPLILLVAFNAYRRMKKLA